MRTALAALLAALTWPLAAQAVPPPPIPPAPPGARTYSDRELAETPPAELAQRLLGDVARRMVEVRPGMVFYGRPELGWIGVCQVERVAIGVVKPSDRTTESYVSGASIEQWYRLVDVSAASTATEQVAATRAGCAAVGPGAVYFRAPYAKTAWRQTRMLREAIAASKGKGRLGFALACGRESRGVCRARDVLAGLSADDTAGVTQVECLGDAKRRECHEVSLGAWTVEVKSRFESDGFVFNEPKQILVAITLHQLPRYMRR